MHKPPRRMHTSTGRFPFSRRSPSKRRAFLGIFNITKSFGRHDTCQRPRISLQIKRCQPITPPIIRRKHREIPIFLPEIGMQGPSIAEYSQKCTSPPPPHGAKQTKARPKGRAPSLIQIYIARNGSTEVTQARGQPTFPAHSAGRENLRRTKCAAEVLSCPRTRRKGRLPSGRTAKTAYATV